MNTTIKMADNQRTTEENFQHFLSYSCAVTDPMKRLRMAYFHGADENVPEEQYISVAEARALGAGKAEWQHPDSHE